MPRRELADRGLLLPDRAMVGAGQLIQRLFGLEHNYAVICVGILMLVVMGNPAIISMTAAFLVTWLASVTD